MKTIAFLTLLVAGSAALAAPPAKKPVNAYRHLWNPSSPFTSPPVANPGGPVVTPFEDWALGGVSEVEGGYMVTLVHKKNVGETRIIKPRGTVHSSKDEMKWLNPGDPKGFKVERVNFGKANWKDTTVLISSGGGSATMKFDDKQLAPVASAASAQNRQPGQPGLQPQVQPGQPVLPSVGGAQPRPPRLRHQR